MDGYLCKHIALLSDLSLGNLSLLLWISQYFADYLPSMCTLAVKLIPKSQKVEEYRPIVLYPTMLRLHLRLLTRFVAQWERRFLADVPFSNAQQRDALNTAFRSMTRMALLDAECTMQQAAPWAHIDVSIDLR
jgi:hypothetical protein